VFCAKRLFQTRWKVSVCKKEKRRACRLSDLTLAFSCFLPLSHILLKNLQPEIQLSLSRLPEIHALFLPRRLSAPNHLLLLQEPVQVSSDHAILKFLLSLRYSRHVVILSLHRLNAISLADLYSYFAKLSHHLFAVPLQDTAVELRYSDAKARRMPEQ